MKTRTYSSPWHDSSRPPDKTKAAEQLYRWLYSEDVTVLNQSFRFSNEATKAVTIRLKANDDWGIFIDKSRMKDSAEEYTTLLHEAGHYATGATHELSSPFDLIEKHEYSADKWAVLQAVTEDELDDAVASGMTELSQLAAHFHITEDLMRKAICWYTHGNIASELYF